MFGKAYPTLTISEFVLCLELFGLKQNLPNRQRESLDRFDLPPRLLPASFFLKGALPLIRLNCSVFLRFPL